VEAHRRRDEAQARRRCRAEAPRRRALQGTSTSDGGPYAAPRRRRRAERQAEEKRLADEAVRKRLAEQKRIAEETERRRLMNRARAAERRLVEETARKRMTEEKRLADEAVRKQQAPDQSRLQDEKLLETLNKLGKEAKRHFILRKTTSDNATLSKLGIRGIEGIPLTQPIIKHLLLMYHPDRYRAGRTIYPRGFTAENVKAVSQFLTARLRNPDVVS
jgi:hypothetical protein